MGLRSLSILPLLVVAALAIAVLTSETQAQPPPIKTSTPSSAKTGSVEGRVFGITQGGDLKPARMPAIYLLYQGLGEHHCVKDVCESTADRQYQISSLLREPNKTSS
jgi:hypothetical protein